MLLISCLILPLSWPIWNSGLMMNIFCEISDVELLLEMFTFARKKK